MKIGRSILTRFVDVPHGRALRTLLDDVGIEVKRMSSDGESLTVELLANRGDHYAYEGIAREIAARTGNELRLPETVALNVGSGPTVHIATDGVLRYSLTPLRRNAEASLSADCAALLLASGLQSVSAAVDATNVANLEWGQPTHAFDADTLTGNVTVRRSRPGETAWLLFQPAAIALPEGTLVIADDVSVLAVAGVIGCESSKTTPLTKNVLLESATFDPILVRKAARALAVHTDSSARFERGADPERVLVGAGRVVSLLEATGAWCRTGPTTDTGWSESNPTVELDLNRAAVALGMPVADSVAKLSRLGFHVLPSAGSTVQVSVPSWRRWDVHEPADLWEELARVISFDQFPTVLPPIDLGSLPSPQQLRQDRVDSVLCHAGFTEVFTDGFYGRAVREWLLGNDANHPLWDHVQTTNAVDRGYALLKNNTLAQAVEVVGVNRAMRTMDVKTFEWTRTFHPSGKGGPGHDESPCTERHVLWAVANGDDQPKNWATPARPVDIFTGTSLIAAIGRVLSIPLRVVAGTQHPLSNALHPGRRASVQLGDRTIGVVGEVHPSILAAARIKGVAPIWLELDADVLLTTEPSPSPFREPPDWVAMERDLAFTVPPQMAAARLIDVLKKSGPDWLSDLWISDRYVHPDGQITLTFALRFDNPPEAARTVVQTNAVLDQLVQAVNVELGPQGVRLR